MTIKEKLRIINLFEENSTGAKTLSHRKLASLATVDLERNVTHTTIRKILRQKDELKKSQTLRKKDVRVRDDSLIEFEKALKVVFDETSKRAELNLDSAREIAKELASSENSRLAILVKSNLVESGCESFSEDTVYHLHPYTTFTVLDADWLMPNWKLKGTRFSDFQKVET